MSSAFQGYFRRCLSILQKLFNHSYSSGGRIPLKCLLSQLRCLRRCGQTFRLQWKQSFMRMVLDYSSIGIFMVSDSKLFKFPAWGMSQ